MEGQIFLKHAKNFAGIGYRLMELDMPNSPVGRSNCLDIGDGNLQVVIFFCETVSVHCEAFYLGAANHQELIIDIWSKENDSGTFNLTMTKLSSSLHKHKSNFAYHTTFIIHDEHTVQLLPSLTGGEMTEVSMELPTFVDGDILGSTSSDSIRTSCSPPTCCRMAVGNRRVAGLADLSIGEGNSTKGVA